MSLHLGIIPDGNRRYCKENNISLIQLIELLYNNIIDLFTAIYYNKLEYIKKITELSIFILSYDNIKKRTIEDLEPIYTIITNLCKYIIKTDKIKEHMYLFEKMKITFVGRLDILPANIQLLIDEINKINIDKTNNNLFNVTIAIAYDPYHDMNNIIHNIDKRPQTPLDLIIRTSGEKRLSGFFPYHSLYAELLFISKYWPEMTIDNINKSIEIYYKRNRRFGK